MAELNWEKTAQYWQDKYAGAVEERNTAQRQLQQALLLARGWKQRAEAAEEASKTDQAIEELIETLEQEPASNRAEQGPADA